MFEQNNIKGLTVHKKKIKKNLHVELWCIRCKILLKRLYVMEILTRTFIMDAI